MGTFLCYLGCYGRKSFVGIVRYVSIFYLIKVVRFYCARTIKVHFTHRTVASEAKYLIIGVLTMF